MGETLDRRRFLKRGAVVAGAATTSLVYGADAGAARADLDGDATVGTVVSTRASDFVLRQEDGTLVRVRPMPGARMYAGAFGETSDCRNLITGDRVFVSGIDRDGVLEASYVGSEFISISATVNGVSEDGLTAATDIGEILIEGGRLPYTPEQPSHGGPVSNGETIRGIGWRDPESGQTYLLRRG